MQQVTRYLRDGHLVVGFEPDPIATPGHVLIVNSASVISSGTEKMVADLARKSLLGKARERPDQVRRVVKRLWSEGFFRTMAQVFEKLDEPMPLGYASAGYVLAVGAGVQDIKPGDRVASNGPHAGVVAVPRNLCAHVPNDVPIDQASFSVLGAIALQGIRLARLGLGETAFVVGLGLVGQLACALLKAQGCRVVGVDLEDWKCDVALKMGADVARTGLGAKDVADLTRGLGADAVLLCAATDSDGPIQLAAEAVRKKGQVVLVGVTGLRLDRRPFYFKECEFVVSCSYGPGRYDPEYEERGHDYPAAYVRWSERRNLQAVLDLMGTGRLDVSPLITHRFKVEEAEKAYELVEKGGERYLGIVLEYPGAEAKRVRRIELKTGNPVIVTKPQSHEDAQRNERDSSCALVPSCFGGDKSLFGFLGAGNFARMVLLPAIRRTALMPHIICSAKGLSAVHAGEKYGFAFAAADEDEVFNDPKIGTVFIATRHGDHARQVVKALKACKNVFVEKPLCLTIEELVEIEGAYGGAGIVPVPEVVHGINVTSATSGRPQGSPLVMVGFNRRFASATRIIKDFFADVSAPLAISIRFNAGAIPPEHWTQSDEEGGGRIVGEACHAIDLATFLAGAPPVRVYAESVGGPGAPKITDDQCFITLRHANGAISHVAYLASGDKAFPKERVEVFGGGRVAVIDDFKMVTTCAGGKTRTSKSWSQDKGYRAEVEAFAEAVLQSEPASIPWDDLRAVARASILTVRSLREGVPFEL